VLPFIVLHVGCIVKWLPRLRPRCDSGPGSSDDCIGAAAGLGGAGAAGLVFATAQAAGAGRVVVIVLAAADRTHSRGRCRLSGAVLLLLFLLPIGGKGAVGGPAGGLWRPLQM
jgi:hypothetical protein